MNKLSKEKRSQLILVSLCTLCALSGLWFGLIRYQQRSLASIQAAHKTALAKLEQMDREIKNAARIQAELSERKEKLVALEENMASGDLYAWVINTIRQFRLKLPYKVEIPQFSQIDGPKEMTMMPGFPYKQATLTIGGSGLFYDFGRFVTDLENAYPYFRVLNVTLEPAAGVLAGDKERLSFRMDIVVLIKPDAA
jgi:hypothetical protein